MGATPDFADAAASLLEADPACRALFGHRRRLPARRGSGPVGSPGAARLGPGTIALAFSTGYLTTARCAPGVPWESHWVARTPARLAVIGSAYLGYLSPWPAVLYEDLGLALGSPSGRLGQ